MYYQAQNQFGLTFDQVRKLYPNNSFPASGHIDLPEVQSYVPSTTPDYDPATHAVRETAPAGGVQRWEVYPLPAEEVQANAEAALAHAWNRIKAERDRRKYLGVKVGAHWFHSDDTSRIQQLALAMMGTAIPAGLQWKTLIKTDQPVFVDMTSALAQEIFQATVASDQAIFAAAEAHRLAMEASDTPESYDISAGWPVSFEDAT
jgi:hypothetical protein